MEQLIHLVTLCSVIDFNGLKEGLIITFKNVRGEWELHQWKEGLPRVKENWVEILSTDFYPKEEVYTKDEINDKITDHKFLL